MNHKYGANSGLDVVWLRLLRVEHLDGMGAARNFEERGRSIAGDTEVLLKFEGIEGGGHDDELEVWTALGEGLEDAHEDVGGKCALMGLIKNDGGIAVEVGVVHGFAEEHTVCHVFKESGAGLSHVFETYRVADLSTELNWEIETSSEYAFAMPKETRTVHLICDTLGNRHGSDSARLSTCDNLVLRMWKIGVGDKLGYSIRGVYKRLFRHDKENIVRGVPTYCVVLPEPVSPTMTMIWDLLN